MLVSIANSDEFLPHRFIDAPYVNLVVHPEWWKDIVSVLIPAAQLIVVHKAGTSPGLEYELDAIREANCEDRTLIVRDRDPPKDNALSRDIMEGYNFFYINLSQGEEKAPLKVHPDPALTGFTVLDWKHSEGVSFQPSVARPAHATRPTAVVCDKGIRAERRRKAALLPIGL